MYVNMNDIYFKTNHRNGLSYILSYIEVKNNKMLFNLRDWVTIVPFISNSVFINLSLS